MGFSRGRMSSKGAGELPGALSAVVSDVMWNLSDPAGATGERATAALTHAIRRVGLVAAAGVQAVMALATLSTVGAAGLPLIVAQTVLAVVALASIRLPVPAPTVALGMYAVGLWSYVVGGGIDSVLVFAACWEINFATCIAGLLVLRRYVVPLAILASLTVSAGMLLLRPDFGADFAITVTITQTSIVLALRLGLPRLLRPAMDADAAAAAAEAAERRTLVAHRSSVRAAEESRILHDTAINTLGAIANGGAGISDARAVREQCGRDVDLLAVLRSEQATRDAAALIEVFAQPRARVVRTGDGDDVLARFERSLPAATTAAIVGCVREAVTNALKHAGVDEVGIDARLTGTGLAITVRDSGSGFSGEVPEDRGIAGSILARAGEHGFAATIESRPGFGTTVALAIPEGASASLPEHDALPGERSTAEERDELRALQRRAAGYWALGVTAIGAVLLLGGGANEHFALVPMLALMLLCWVTSREGRDAAPSVLRSAVLIASTCAVFLLSGLATGFGTVGAIHWQALAPTGPFVLLLAHSSHRAARRIGVGAWVALGAGMAAWIAPSSSVAAQIVVVATCVGLGFSVVWGTFQAWAFRLGETAARSRRAALAARLQADLDDAARANYRRWVDAGLESAVRLLREIADGRRAPTDVATRSDCGDEERYLRQLVQMSPELVHLSRALIPALRLARDADIALDLRLGGIDAPDAASADEIASTVIRSIADTGRGERLAASLFPADGELRLTLVGSGVAAPARAAARARFDDLGPVRVLELAYPRGEPLRGSEAGE